MPKRHPSLCENLCRNAPTLKYYGFGFWFAWSFSSFSKFSPNDRTPLSGLDPAVFFSVSTACLLLTTILLMLLTARSRRIFELGATSIAFGVVGTVGVALMSVAPMFRLSVPLSGFMIAGSALTGISSAFFALKIGQVFGALNGRESSLLVLRNALLAIVIYYLLLGLSEVESLTLYVSLFAIAGLLLALDSHARETMEIKEAVYGKPPLSVHGGYT